MSAAIAVELLPREPPLAPLAVVATGERARALGLRLLLEPDERLTALRGLAGPGLLAVLGGERGNRRARLAEVASSDDEDQDDDGDAVQLPWVDGVIYLGRDAAAPRLLLPTALRPSVAVELFEPALLRHLERARPDKRPPLPPLAVVPASAEAPPLVFSLAEARPISRARLTRWLERGGEGAA